MRYLYHARFQCDVCGTVALVQPPLPSSDRPWSLPVPNGWSSGDIWAFRDSRANRTYGDFCPACLDLSLVEILAILDRKREEEDAK